MKYKEKLELAAPPNGSYCLLQKKPGFWRSADCNEGSGNGVK